MSASRPGLVRDQSGAMMVMGLFMALFLIGSLYYILGVGDAILYKRVIQDSADAGAFAASVTAAKGMNLIALMNIIMMIQAGVLMSAKLVLAVLGETYLILTLECIACEGTCDQCDWASDVAQSTASVADTASEVQDAVEGTVESLHQVQLAIKESWPVLAAARARHEITERSEFSPPVVGGFVLPAEGPSLYDGTQGLPVEEDDSSEMCDRAIDPVIDYAPIAILGLMDIDAQVYATGVGTISTSEGAAHSACSSLEPPFKVVDSRSTGGQVWLGHEEFQHRAYAIGEEHREGRWQTGERGVRASQGFHQNGRDFAHSASMVGRVGMAQAEFYWNGTASKEEWMWRLDWTARLRRLSTPKTTVSIQGLEERCLSAAGEWAGQGAREAFCSAVGQLTRNSVSVH